MTRGPCIQSFSYNGGRPYCILVIQRDLSIKANVCSNSTELSNKHFEIQVLRSLRLSDSS